jgi:hypothetical protein
MMDQQTFVPLPETMPVLTIGLLGVKVPTEWGMSLDNAQWNYMRDMRLEEIERRILAIEAQGMAPEGRGREGGPGSSELPSPVAESDAPKGGSS